jgi:hypothetical protein
MNFPAMKACQDFTRSWDNDRLLYILHNLHLNNHRTKQTYSQLREVYEYITELVISLRAE